MKTRREIVYEASKGYKKLSKKEKTERLDNLVAITGYNRDYASRLLSQHDRCVYYTETHKGWTHSEYRGYTLSITENNL